MNKTQEKIILLGAVHKLCRLGRGTVLPNGVKVAVSDQSQKCQKLTKVGLACSLQLY